jgi:hypothetical protein
MRHEADWRIGVHVIDLNGGGIKIEVADFCEKMHAKDYLDW